MSTEKHTLGVFSLSQSFSGCDIIPLVYGAVPFKTEIPNEQSATELNGGSAITKKEVTGYMPGVFNLGMLTTLSYSIHTDKRPVLPCGQRKPKGFTSGIQTIAGLMIFTVMNDHPLIGLLGDSLNDVLKGTNDISLIPAFDLTIVIANEAGNVSVLNIFAIEFIDEGFTTSVNDIYSELTTQYVCRDVSIIKSISPQDMDQIYIAGNRYMGIK